METYEVTYTIDGLQKTMFINAQDAITAQILFTNNMYGNGKVQIINIRRV